MIGVMRGCVIGLLLASTGLAQAVTLDAAGQRRLSVAVAALQAGRAPAPMAGFAYGVDAVPLASLDGDIVAAAAMAVASAAEAHRAQTLAAADATVSRRVAEAAVAQARGDAARLLALRRRLGLEWGAAIAGFSDHARSAMLASIVAGQGALVRIEAPVGTLSGVRSVMLDLGEAGIVTARILGPARTLGPRQAAGVLALVSGRNAALIAVGLAVPVRGGDGFTAGVMVPAAAVLRQEGHSWVYVRRGAADFERRMLVAPAAVSGGLFVATGLRVGDPVVVRGAAQLFTAEHLAKAD